MKCTKEYFLLLLLILPFPLWAQLGPHAENIKWQQINTEKVNVIFPEGFDQQGLRVVNLVNWMEQNNKRSIGPLSEKINIILHNQTMVPNGFVGIAPFRSEFFATPPQSANFLGTVDWIDALAIHEYRHVLQYANAKVGITKLLYFLQGENGWGLASGAAVPNWFWEGDATIIETALTNGGRGRVPFFTLEQRAILLNNRDYSYQKARNRSFKDIVPNHYRLGYQMLMHGRERYGNDFWQPIFENAARYKPLLYPFSRALKHKTGLSTKDLYQVTYKNLKEKWVNHLANIDLIPTEKIPTSPKKTVTHYRFPFVQKDGSIVCLKASFEETDALVRIKNGQEEQLTFVGFHLEDYLSVVGHKAIWTEYEQDPRRSNRNYSNIVVYDFETEDRTQFTLASRYLSPTFSNSMGRVLAVQISPEQKNNLVIMNAVSGRQLAVIPNPTNRHISFPKWGQNDTEIIYIGKENSQLAIFKFNLINKKTEQLTDWTHHAMADLFIHEQRAYFTASFSGIDNIYSVPLDGSKQIRPLTSVKIGAFYPSVSVDGQTLVFSEFTDMGYELSQQSLTKVNSRTSSFEIIEPTQQPFYAINTTNEEGGNILNQVPVTEHPVERFRGFFKGMSLHSWNFTPSLSLPTLDIQIDNYLNDFSMNLIGGYNVNESAPVYVASATYGKWYPQLTAFTSFSNRNTVAIGRQDSLFVQDFDQLTVGGRISLPLIWVQGNYSTSIQLFSGYSHQYLSNVEFRTADIEGNPLTLQRAERDLGTIQFGFSVSNLRRRAIQNLESKFGQTLSIRFQQTTQSRADRQIRVTSNLFFPGFENNHSLKLGVGYQRELLRNRYQFSDVFEYPRGFGSFLNDEFLRLTADYKFPLGYPDWGFGGITYFKRVSMNVFFDYGRRRIIAPNFADNHSSIGAEFIFDNQFWNELPVTFGVRNSYRLTTDVNRYQFDFFVRNFIQ